MSNSVVREIRKGNIERVGFTVVEDGDPSGFAPTLPGLKIHYPDGSMVTPGSGVSVTAMDVEYLWDTTALTQLGVYRFCWGYTFDTERFQYEQKYIMKASC